MKNNKMAQLLKLLELFEDNDECSLNNNAEMTNLHKDFCGKEVLIRSYDAGVFFGILKSSSSDQVILEDYRRIWKWEGAFTLTKLANDGTEKPSECKFSEFGKEILIFNVIEIIPCTKNAIKSIKGVTSWSP